MHLRLMVELATPGSGYLIGFDLSAADGAWEAFNTAAGTPEAYRDRIRRNMKKYEQVVRSANIQAN